MKKFEDVLLFWSYIDEIIRQVTINNAERGLLLMRIRDEIRMTLAAHIRLFESGFVYGTRKSNLVEDGYENLQTAIRELKEEKESLEVQMQNLAITIDQSERKHSETREVNEKRAADEIQFLKRANHQLRVSSRFKTNITTKPVIKNTKPYHFYMIQQEQLEGIQGIKKSWVREIIITRGGLAKLYNSNLKDIKNKIKRLFIPIKNA